MSEKKKRIAQSIERDKIREEYATLSGKRAVDTLQRGFACDEWFIQEYTEYLESALIREREKHEHSLKCWKEILDLSVKLKRELTAASDRIKELETQIEAMKCCDNCEHELKKYNELPCENCVHNACLVGRTISHWQLKGVNQ